MFSCMAHKLGCRGLAAMGRKRSNPDSLRLPLLELWKAKAWQHLSNQTRQGQGNKEEGRGSHMFQLLVAQL